MTFAKLQSVFEKYDQHLNHMGAVARRDEDSAEGCGTSFHHLRWMCQQALEDFLPNRRIEKAMRWLGYVQAGLVFAKVFTLSQVKEHSTPDPVVPEVGKDIDVYDLQPGDIFLEDDGHGEEFEALRFEEATPENGNYRSLIAKSRTDNSEQRFGYTVSAYAPQLTLLRKAVPA